MISRIRFKMHKLRVVLEIELNVDEDDFDTYDVEKNLQHSLLTDLKNRAISDPRFLDVNCYGGYISNIRVYGDLGTSTRIDLIRSNYDEVTINKSDIRDFKIKSIFDNDKGKRID